MCSNSSDQCILCSEDTWINVKETYTDFVKTTKFIKGKGDMNIYLYNPYKNKSALWQTNIGLLKKDTLRATNVGKFGKNYNRRPSAIIQQEYLNNVVKKDGKELVKQNTVFENSNFVYETSIDLGRSNSPGKKDERKKEKSQHQNLLSRAVTKGGIAKDQNGRGANEKDNNEEVNEFYQNSTYFYKFNNPTTEKTFNGYMKQKFEKYFEKSHVINLCFLLTMTIGLYDFFEFGGYDSMLYVLNIVKITSYLIFLFIVNLVHTIKKREKLFKGLIGGGYLLISIIIQVQVKFLPKNFLINLALEQNFVILCGTYNG